MTQPSSVRRILLPLVPLYRLALALRELRLGSSLEPVRRLRFPVVSIGSLSAGGSGKTPLAIALAQAFTRCGFSADVLSRGYGRKSHAALRVDPNGSAEEFGDEPLLIAREAGVPVYVAAQRFRAGLLAEDAFKKASRGTQTSQQRNELGSSSLKGTGFSSYINAAKSAGALTPEAISSGNLHLLDDGFQHRQLHRDVDILLLDNRDWNDHLLPAGNLREPLSAMRRASALAIPAGDTGLEGKLKDAGWQGPIWHLHRRMDVPQIDGPVVAFCGIARSEQFFAGLEAAGLHLASRIAFPDHHHYKPHDFDCIQDAARSIGASAIVTTEKDRVRLGKLAASFPEAPPLKTAILRIDIEDEGTVVDWLTDRLATLSKSDS